MLIFIDAGLILHLWRSSRLLPEFDAALATYAKFDGERTLRLHLLLAIGSNVMVSAVAVCIRLEECMLLKVRLRIMIVFASHQVGGSLTVFM